MRSIILVLALTLAAATAVPVEQNPDATALDLAKELGIDFNLEQDLSLDFGPQDGTMTVDEFGLVDKLVSGLIAESKALARDIVRLTERQLLKIFLYPIRQLEQLAEDIEHRAVESEECVARESLVIAGVVEDTTLEFMGCGRDAAVTSINLILDTKRAVLQLTVDGYQLVKLARRCKSHTSETRKKMCKVQLYANAVSYAYSGQQSLRHLIGLRRSVPAVATDATSCTGMATEKAIQGYADINASIDTCINTIFF